MALLTGNDPNPIWTGIWISVGAIVTVASVIALQAMFYRIEDAEIVRKTVAPEEIAILRTKQQADQNRYRWVSEADGRAGIPIDRAMELVVRDLAAGGDSR